MTPTLRAAAKRYERAMGGRKLPLSAVGRLLQNLAAHECARALVAYLKTLPKSAPYAIVETGARGPSLYEQHRDTDRMPTPKRRRAKR